MSRDPRLERLKQATEPTPAAVEGLRARVLPPSAGPLLRHLPSPEGKVALRPPPAPAPRWRWRPAAAGLTLLGLVGYAVAPAPASEVDLAVHAVEGLTAEGVGKLRQAGHGALTRGTAVVDWQVGTLRAEVDARDPVLTVVTREGEATVGAGTLTVIRDALGTRFLGAPARCGGGRDGALCLPVTAVGWLARAQALADAGAPVEAVVAASDAGLRLGAGDRAVTGELVATQVDAWLRAGRRDEAARAAKAYPAGGPRENDLAPLIGTAP